VRRAVVIFVAAAACGRIGFDRSPSGDAGPFDDADPPGDGGPTPPLLCGETFTNTAGALSSSGPLTAAVVGRHLVALWIDGGGALRGTTWTAAPSGVTVAQDGVAIAPAPIAGPMWATTNGDTMLVVTTEASQAVLRFLHEDLSPALPKLPLGGSLVSSGRHPITRERNGTGFVVIAIGGDVPAIAVIRNGMPPNQAFLLLDLRFHGVPSIADDRNGYAVVTELADQFGPGCWLTRLADSFAVTAGPGSLESTQQADCDSSIATASAGASGAGTAWMDRDPVNSYVEFRGTDGGGNTASMSGEVGAGQPLITATSTGFAVAYRSALGLRVFDRGGPRTLDPDPVVFDLVTWADRAILVWTKLGDARPRLTRLCP
jgi:hypothetical protein